MSTLSSQDPSQRTKIKSADLLDNNAVMTVKIASDGRSYGPCQRRRLQAASVGSPDAFDRLRFELANLDDYDAASVSFPTRNSSIFEVNMPSHEKLVTYRLAELKVFIALSNGLVPIATNMDEGFAVILAAHHFNNMQDVGHPVLGDYVSRYPELMSCNVKLTLELFDSQLSPAKTTQQFTAAWRRPVSIGTPPATAVVGSSRSSETTPLAIFTGVNLIPQVSATSTSTIFDDKDQFPLFGRTVSSTNGEAAAAVRFFASIGSTHVAILFVTDAYGSVLQESFRDEAHDIGIKTDSFPYDSSASEEYLLRMFASLKKSKFHHVYAICFEEMLVPILNAAVKAEVIGRDFLYVFPTVDPLSIEEVLRDAPATSRTALHGAGFIHLQGGVATQRMKQGELSSPMYNEYPTTSFDRFRLSWRDAVRNDTLVNYIRSKFPAVVTGMPSFVRFAEFNRDPNGYLNFNYDAVTALGLAMCRAGKNKTFFTGEDINAQFRLLDFEGASGRVKILPETGTRDYATIAFTIWNIRISDVDSTIEYILSARFEQDKWNEIRGNAFEFANGGTLAPESLPPVPFNFNYIGNASRAITYTCAGFVMLAALMSVTWTIFHINDQVVDTARPAFLFIISFGAFIMATSLFPLGLDESVVSNVGDLDYACMAVPWLYFTGASIALGALLAKAKSVNKAYIDPEILEVQVSSTDIFVFTGGIASLNALVLLLWSVTTPLTWTRRELDSTDSFNRTVESYAICNSNDSIGFVFALIAINFTFLLVGTFWAYRTRNIATEYNESRFIGLTIAAILQAWSTSIPVVTIVQTIPLASYFVKSGVIVLTALFLLSFVYLPKVFAAHSESRKVKTRPRPVKKFARNPNSGNVDSGDNGIARLSSTEEKQTAQVASSRRTSVKIIHNPRSSGNMSLSGGVELSMRQLEVFRDTDDVSSPNQADCLDRRVSELSSSSLQMVDEHDGDCISELE